MEPLERDVRNLMKIGESLAITIPKEFVKKYNLTSDDFVIVTWDGKELKVYPLKKEKLEMVERSLESLTQKQEGGEESHG